MKIWLLTSEFPPIYGGGISTYCIQTSKMFSDFGHDVTVITPDFQVKNITKTREGNYAVIRFNPDIHYTTNFLGYEANLSYAFAEVVKDCILKYGAPDIIESQEYMGIAYYLLQRKWLRYPEFSNTKIVITLHAPSFLYFEYNKVSHYKLPYFWIGEMERFCIRAADLVISPSNYLVSELKSRMKLDDVPIHVLKNPYKIDWELPQHQVIKKKIAYFGKLTPQKGCLEVIGFFKKLWDEGYDCSLVMIGGGDHLYHPEGTDMINHLRQKYGEQIKSGKLQLLGAIKPAKINEHLDNTHIVVVPSVVDNLPYTVIEAMGRGKIVLASQQGGQSEVIKDGVNGFLFDHHTEDSFKKKIDAIFALSDESSKKIGEEAYKEINQTYSYTVIFKQKNQLFDQLLKQTGNNPVFPFIRPIECSQPINIVPAEPLLSIVVPYYNMGAYVSDTIAALLNSDYKNIEIIIVNDGSTEKHSIEILNTFQANGVIKIIHKRNEGLALARNTGAIAAKGDYLAFLDPDDTIERGYHKKAIELLRAYTNVYFVGCWARYFGDSKGYWPAFNPEPPYLLIHNMINSSALVYKRNAFLNSGMNDPQMIYGMEDYESVISMVKNGYHGVVLPEPLWNYRIRKTSMARAFTREKQIFLYRLISEKHSSFYAIFASSIANLLNANGPGIDYDNPTLIYKFSYSNNKVVLKLKQFVIKKIKSNPRIRKFVVGIINVLNRK